MEEYDPNQDPPPEEWLILDELKRISLNKEYHRRHRIRAPNGQRHAVVHAIVENQLALAEPVVVATLARLRSEGLSRHEAIHAIGSVLSDHLDSLLRDPHGLDQSNEGYHDAGRKLRTERSASMFCL